MKTSDYIYSADRKKYKINKEYYPASADNLPPSEVSGSKNQAYDQDEKNAKRGFVAETKSEEPVHTDGNPKLVAWDMKAYQFMDNYPIDQAPQTVNPVL